MKIDELCSFIFVIWNRGWYCKDCYGIWMKENITMERYEFGVELGVWNENCCVIIEWIRYYKLRIRLLIELRIILPKSNSSFTNKFLIERNFDNSFFVEEQKRYWFDIFMIIVSNNLIILVLIVLLNSIHEKQIIRFFVFKIIIYDEKNNE